MNKALLGLAALATGCALQAHTTPRVYNWTEMAPGDSAVIHSCAENSMSIAYYGPERNTADGPDDDVVFIGQYIPFESYEEAEFHVGDGDIRDVYGYRFKFDIANDNDGIIENNKMVVYWDKL